MRTLIRTASRPASPPGLGPGQCRGRVGLLRFPLMRGKPDQAEPHLVSCRDRELRGDRAVRDVEIDGGAQGERLRSGHGDGTAGHGADEGNAVPIVEPRVQLQLHWDAPAQPFDEADDVGTSFPGRHAVDDAHRTLRRLEVRFQDQRPWPVTAIDTRRGDGGSNQPSTVVFIAEERRETGRRIEARKAQPIDGAVIANECNGFCVSDDGVVFDAERHLVPHCRCQRTTSCLDSRRLTTRTRQRRCPMLRHRQNRLRLREVSPWARRAAT